MSELRAPDPTLDALFRTGTHDRIVLVTADLSSRGGSVAHLPEGPFSTRTERTLCGKFIAGGFRVHQARHARWFAVPCRECFPEAPEPGTDPLTRPNTGRYLGWQVTP